MEIVMAKSDYNKPAREGWSRSYEIAWLKLYGKVCPKCKGIGWIPEHDKELGALQFVQIQCPRCKGIGYIKKDKDEI